MVRGCAHCSSLFGVSVKDIFKNSIHVVYDFLQYFSGIILELREVQRDRVFASKQIFRIKKSNFCMNGYDASIITCLKIHFHRLRMIGNVSFAKNIICSRTTNAVIKTRFFIFFSSFECN